ncbi:ankyrin repeat domain-containing protein [Variovorax sp. ZS18.2.2]|uniref:ankyrin repeat domain-containing protein n=1 Tax=Variovorax sp. ZS18.2.2 TaxID=2971255 RepID=UPI002150C6E9|nr:ankyrin repeat domain-containing protein [Variovorax sp. ZS18.2.2]MCR6477909.1 ankyrin repeat domain-containing protein [Variovorax sp. ZS18.2.2]
MKFDLGRDLFDACIAGDLSRVEEVLEKSDSSCLVWRDMDGRTALHAAIESRNVEMAARLLAAGAKTSAVDRIGDTPLHLALHVELEGSNTSDNQLVLTRLLLDAGADPAAPGSDRTPAIGLARLYKSVEAERLLSAHLEKKSAE